MYGVYSQQSGGGVSVPEVIIAGGINSRIFRSTDDGLSFTTQIVNHPSYSPNQMQWRDVFYCNGKFFISCSASYNGCMVSHDFGLTWENISNESMQSIVWNGTYYFAGINNQIRRSADLVTWENLTNQGTAYQRGDDLCVVGNDVYWSNNRNTSLSPERFLGIQKCVAPYNSGNISLIGVPNPSAISTSTTGRLYKTSNGLILTDGGSGSHSRIFSTTNYTTLTSANSTYNGSGIRFSIVVGSNAYRFGSTSVVGRGYGSPIISTLSSTTSPNNTNPSSIGLDTNGTIFVSNTTSSSTNIWTRNVTANTTAWTIANIGITSSAVFYTGKSFLVYNTTQLKRSVTGIGGWSAAITPFGSYGNNFSMASSYKTPYDEL